MMDGTTHPSLRIALIAEDRLTYLSEGYPEDSCAALTHSGEIQAVFDALTELGHSVTLIPGIQALVRELADGKHATWDLAFNMAQGFHGPAREVQIPALLDAYRIPYTFSDTETMALCQNKGTTKIVLNHYKIPTAPFQVISNKSGTSGKDNTLIMKSAQTLPSYPLFVKPIAEGSSKGIETFNKINDAATLHRVVQNLKRKFPDQDILVEPFLPGREFTISILGTGPKSRVIGIREHLWKKKEPLSNGRVKNATNDYHTTLDFANRESKGAGTKLLAWNDEHDFTNPEIETACRVALAAWNVLGCRDAGRVDLRFDSEEPDAVPDVLEVNPISGLLPGHSPLPASAERNGISFKQLIAAIVGSAIQRT
ncbi:hypothetical protein BDW66DRAFT_168463 [Aspergillus desertorum]